jgi:hypothetical protein
VYVNFKEYGCCGIKDEDHFLHDCPILNSKERLVITVNRVNRSPTSVYAVTYQIQTGGDEQGTSFAMCKMPYRRQQHSKIHLFGLSGAAA